MSMRSLPFFIGILVLSSVSLGGCTDLKRALGTEKVIPDEFAVVNAAPLAVPPDYSLRPPQPGAAPTQEVSSVDQAKQSIFRVGDNQAGALPPGADQRSPGENELLRHAGAGNAPADIRAQINQEALAKSPIDQGFVDKLLFWQDTDKPAGVTDSVINPQREAQRLRGGSPTSPGATPAGATATASAAPAPPAAPQPPAGMTALPTITRKGSPSMLGAS